MFLPAVSWTCWTLCMQSNRIMWCVLLQSAAVTNKYINVDEVISSQQVQAGFRCFVANRFVDCLRRKLKKVHRNNFSLHKTLCWIRVVLLRIQVPSQSKIFSQWLMILQIREESLLAADTQRQTHAPPGRNRPAQQASSLPRYTCQLTSSSALHHPCVSSSEESPVALFH